VEVVSVLMVLVKANIAWGFDSALFTVRQRFFEANLFLKHDA